MKFTKWKKRVLWTNHHIPDYYESSEWHLVLLIEPCSAKRKWSVFSGDAVWQHSRQGIMVRVKCRARPRSGNDHWWEWMLLHEFLISRSIHFGNQREHHLTQSKSMYLCGLTNWPRSLARSKLSRPSASICAIQEIQHTLHCLYQSYTEMMEYSTKNSRHAPLGRLTGGIQ